MIQPIQPRPDLIEEVYAGLKSAIVLGTIGPEESLGQEDLAARLGVSRQPVSHALVLLKRDGLVVERGRRGLMVAPVEPQRILQIYQVRGALDALAAELAAAQASKGAIPPFRRAAITEVIETGREAVAGGEIKALVEADVAFHRSIYELSGNPAIAEIAAGGWVHMQRSMGVVLAAAGYRERVWDEHAAILDAVLGGDGALARDRARAHAEEAGRQTFERLMDGRSVA